jgi:lysophospholipase L1-like esterase
MFEFRRVLMSIDDLPQPVGLRSLPRPWAWLFPLLALLSIAGCGDRQATLMPLATDAVILAFGDSLTFGTGAPRDASYPAVLEELTGRTVIRSGVPGELSSGGLARLPSTLDTHQPMLLILCHGGNDMLRRTGPEQMADNLRAMIALARDRDVQVVLVGVPKPGLFLTAAEIYGEIAAEAQIPIEAEALADILGDSALKSDAIHPNASGYRRLAEVLAALLKEAGAV